MFLAQASPLREPLQLGNAIWFIILAALCTILTIYTLWKKKSLKLVVLQFCISAVAGFFEDIVFIGLKSYEYYPLVLKDPYHDMVLGAYLSQMVYVSSVALFIAAFHLGWRAILIFTGMFVAIEFLFLALGVYKLNWWNPGYTAAGLIFYFYIAKKWYSSLVQGPSRIMRLITLFCMCQILYGNLMVYVTFAGHYHMAIGLFDSEAKDTMLGIIASITIRAAIVALICWFRRYWALPAAAVLFTAGHLGLRHLGTLAADYGWLSAFVLSDLIVVLCCYYVDRKVLIRPQSSSPSNINLVKTR